MASILERAGARYHGLSVTKEQHSLLPDDGFKYDMIDGVLFVSPSAEPEHGKSQARFARFLDEYLDHSPSGTVMVEIDTFLPDGRDVLRPDLSFVLTEHAAILLRQIHGVPDLVCEVLSDSTARRDLTDKADRYLASGVREYWILDPRDKTIQLWINRGNAWEKHNEPVLRGVLLPGFEIVQSRFFR